MHHGGAGEIDIAVAEIHGGADLREPTAAPHPATEDGIENRADEEFAEQEAPERDALADGADDDVAGGFHEDDFEEDEAVAAGVISGPGKEEAFRSEEHTSEL